MNQQFFLQEALLQAIQRNSELRFESGGNKVIYVKPDSAYDINKEKVEVRGSAEIVYLEGRSPNRFISRKEVAQIYLWVDKNFKVQRAIMGNKISPRIEETLEVPRDSLGKNPLQSKEDLETPPFYKDKHTL